MIPHFGFKFQKICFKEMNDDNRWQVMARWAKKLNYIPDIRNAPLKN